MTSRNILHCRRDLSVKSWDEIELEEWQLLSTLVDLGLVHKGRMGFALTQLCQMKQVVKVQQIVSRLECQKAFQDLQVRLKEWIAGVGEFENVIKESEKVLKNYE